MTDLATLESRAHERGWQIVETVVTVRGQPVTRRELVDSGGNSHGYVDRVIIDSSEDGVRVYAVPNPQAAAWDDLEITR